jgi:Domain of unknown function (DUF4136)
MKRTAKRTAAAVLAVLAACSSVNVNTDFDHGANFTSYKTYSWRSGQAVPNVEMNNHIVGAIDRQLGSVGLSKVESGGDLRVTYDAAMGQRLDPAVLDYPVYGPGWDAATMNARVRNYDIGTLVIDLADQDGRRLVWRGTASGVVGADPKETQRLVDDAVKHLFNDYPPRR